ncbi:MAG: hypothetical protein CVU56_05995 [Deltaproteobacteria bacterium HGW-Deltaproteobacteria-14]|jgi:hypothetical protein|nr:MAG: hypothetical protein CVU56_05995 [Deltaproteobacteria bacterium HGW-Deltaproteobacteria-14]
MLTLGVACASSAPVTPVEVVDAQVAAIRAGDLAQAHALLTPEARVVAPQWPRAADVAAPVDAVELSRSARWERAGGALVLERAASGWQIRAGVLGLMRAGTPEEALTSFALAILSRDYRALLNLLPQRDRPMWTADRLAAAFDAPATRARWIALAQGLRGGPAPLTWIDRARVRAAVGESTVVLVREDGGWKVFDVLPASVYTRP